MRNSPVIDIHRPGVVLLTLVLCAASLGAATDKSLVLHYNFDKGVGRVIIDRSGRKNHGKIVGKPVWVKEGPVTGVSLNGVDTYIECGKRSSLALSKAGTLEVWCLPEAIQGGLISWHTGAGWGDQRLVLGFMNYGLVYKDICVAIGDGAWGISFKEGHSPNVWAHLVMTFDGKDLTLYRDGALVQSVQQEFEPVTKGVPVRIGLCDGLGDAYFKGLIDDVRVYNRALSAEEVAANFKAKAKALGLAVTQTVAVVPELHAKEGKLKVKADFDALDALPAGAIAKIALWNTEKKTWVADTRKEIPKDSRTLTAVFPTDNLVAGDHELRLSVVDEGGIPVGVEAIERFHFPRRAQRAGAAPGVRILNNLVSELVNRDDLPAQARHEIGFTNPRQGWVFIASTAELKGDASVLIAMDDPKAKPVIVQRADGPATRETLRFLPPGEHVLHISSRGAGGEALPAVKKLIVRSIPETMQCGHPTRSLAGYGDYDFKFLEKDVLPNLTTLVGGLKTVNEAELTAWKGRGRRWLLEQNLPSLVNRAVPVTPEVAYNWWTKSLGFQNPLVDGVMADEFSQGDHPSYLGYIAAVKRMADEDLFQDKVLYNWCASRSIHSVEALSKRYVETALESGCKIAHEAYLVEKRTAPDARRLIENKIGRQMRFWKKGFPGVMEEMILVLGYLAAPPETLNVHPNVDLKVFLDMQFNYLANAPECFGLYGAMVYKARYSDEETVRWAGRLFRHYCIEGNTDLLSERYGYKYELKHVLNGDFDDGLDHWSVQAAHKGSVGTRKMVGLGRMQGRVAAAVGNRALWTKRSKDKPNLVSQEIKGLVPGKLYCMKMMAIDYEDWVQGKSERKVLALSVRLDNVDILKDKSFTIPNHGFVRVGPFLKPDSGVPWHNYHWLVFKAKAETATFTLSDWTDDKTPGGPIGQEHMFNFIEIQPYFGE